jgi:hypothetical protein
MSLYVLCKLMQQDAYIQHKGSITKNKFREDHTDKQVLYIAESRCNAKDRRKGHPII